MSDFEQWGNYRGIVSFHHVTENEADGEEPLESRERAGRKLSGRQVAQEEECGIELLPHQQNGNPERTDSRKRQGTTFNDEYLRDLLKNRERIYNEGGCPFTL